jgi:hypothetical protein
MSDLDAETEVGRDADWPSLSNKAFVEVHSFRGAWTAKRTDERLYRMIRGFHDAGDVIVAESEAEPHRSLNLLYPAIFNYRQSLELHLKYLLMAYGPSAGEAPDFRYHGLRNLWAKCKRVILFFVSDLKPPDKIGFEAAEALIGEFHAVDPGSDAFRFAHDTNGKAIKLAISEIDLSNLRKVVGSLHNFLECVDLQLHYGYGVARCEH